MLPHSTQIISDTHIQPKLSPKYYFSDMGLTAMDLFNDILTQENDLKNFLTQSDVKQNQVSTSNPGLIIQGRNSRTVPLSYCP